MEKLLMILVICVVVKAVENRHHPKFPKALDHYERTKGPVIKVPCSPDLDSERDSLIEKAQCGAPKEVFVELKHMTAHEEIHPRAVWVKRCVGLCDHLGPDAKCMPSETIIRHIPVKVTSMRTNKESCSLYAVEEHVSCHCCTGSPESCAAGGRVFNPPEYAVESF